MNRAPDRPNNPPKQATGRPLGFSFPAIKNPVANVSPLTAAHAQQPERQTNEEASSSSTADKVTDFSDAGQRPSLGFVSVDDLVNEITKHHDSDQLRSQIAELRAERIDLRTFLSNLPKMFGAKVLLDRVVGLRRKDAATSQAAKEG
jgi:hypothetical protein